MIVKEILIVDVDSKIKAPKKYSDFSKSISQPLFDFSLYQEKLELIRS